MSYANVTPNQALSRLLAAAKQINADECKDERVFQALQGEIGVAEGVLRDYVEPEPVAYMAFASNGNVRIWTAKNNLGAKEAAEKDGLVLQPVYAAPIAAQSAVAAASVPEPEMREVLRDALASGLSGYMRECDLYPASDCGDLLDELCDLAIAALAPSAASPLHEAGNAAAVQELTIIPKFEGSFSSYQNWVNKAQSWIASPDHRRAICVDSLGRRCAIGADFMRARDEETYPVYFFWECELAAAAPSIAAPTEVERDADDVPDAWKLMLAGVVNELGATYKSIEQNAPNLVVSLGQFRRLQMAKQFLIDSGLPVIAAIATGEKA